MKLAGILKILEDKVAPVALSDELCKKFGMYDNSGVIADCGDEIVGVTFSLDLSRGAIAEAKRRGHNLIVTHHPAIYGGISRINYADPIAECVKCGISVISMHLNFDCAPRGIDYHLMKGLGGGNAKILIKLSDGGYGRVYDIEPFPFFIYVEEIKIAFQSERVLAYGENKLIKKVASFCGAGCDDNAIAFATESGVDAFVSSDMKHHEIAELLRRGINVIVLTHYASENYGFGKIYNEISTDLPVPSAYHDDAELR